MWMDWVVVSGTHCSVGVDSNSWISGSKDCRPGNECRLARDFWPQKDWRSEFFMSSKVWDWWLASLGFLGFLGDPNKESEKVWEEWSPMTPELNRIGSIPCPSWARRMGLLMRLEEFSFYVFKATSSWWVYSSLEVR